MLLNIYVKTELYKFEKWLKRKRWKNVAPHVINNQMDAVYCWCFLPGSVINGYSRDMILLSSFLVRLLCLMCFCSALSSLRMCACVCTMAAVNFRILFAPRGRIFKVFSGTTIDGWPMSICPHCWNTSEVSVFIHMPCHVKQWTFLFFCFCKKKIKAKK